MVGDSGKAMQGTVPAAGTAIRELSRTFEESDHTFQVAASLSAGEDALAEPKRGNL